MVVILQCYYTHTHTHTPHSLAAQLHTHTPHTHSYLTCGTIAHTHHTHTHTTLICGTVAHTLTPHSLAAQLHTGITCNIIIRTNASAAIATSEMKMSRAHSVIHRQARPLQQLSVSSGSSAMLPCRVVVPMYLLCPLRVMVACFISVAANWSAYSTLVCW